MVFAEILYYFLWFRSVYAIIRWITDVSVNISWNGVILSSEFMDSFFIWSFKVIIDELLSYYL